MGWHCCPHSKAGAFPKTPVGHTAGPQDPVCQPAMGNGAGWPGTGLGSPPRAAPPTTWGDLGTPSQLRSSLQWLGHGQSVGWPTAPGRSQGMWLLPPWLGAHWAHSSAVPTVVPPQFLPLHPFAVHCLGMCPRSDSYMSPVCPAALVSPSPECRRACSLHACAFLCPTCLLCPLSYLTAVCPHLPRVPYVSHTCPMRVPTSHMYPLCVPRVSPVCPPRPTCAHVSRVPPHVPPICPVTRVSLHPMYVCYMPHVPVPTPPVCPRSVPRASHVSPTPPKRLQCLPHPLAPVSNTSHARLPPAPHTPPREPGARCPAPPRSAAPTGRSRAGPLRAGGACRGGRAGPLKARRGARAALGRGRRGRRGRGRRMYTLTRGPSKLATQRRTGTGDAG